MRGLNEERKVSVSKREKRGGRKILGSVRDRREEKGRKGGS